MTSLPLWWRRRRLRGRPRGDALAAFAAADPPPRSTRAADVEFVCLDMETTGLDPREAEILSIGWVRVERGRVELSTAATRLVRPAGDVGQSAIVHGLTDTACESGGTLRDAFDDVLEALTGRVLVVHHAGLDKVLLNRCCREFYGASLPVPVVDTLALERRRRQRHDSSEAGESLRLMELRSRYGLPHYAGHDCLVDAIATAELLLAMVAARGGFGAVPLRSLLT